MDLCRDYAKRSAEYESTDNKSGRKCRWDPTENNCDIFWKCRNKKKRVTSSEIRRNEFDRDKSSPYAKREPTPQPNIQTCLPTSSTSYNACGTSTSSSSDDQQQQNEANTTSTSSRRAISVYDQLHEQDFWCPRCNGKMEEPRLLACLHSLCNCCINELMSKDYHGLSRLVRDQHDGFQVQRQQEGCPICDFPLPKFGSPAPPPHYSLQHRLVIYAVRRRLSQRAICCDSCADEVQAVQHCPTCLCNFCQDCGTEHKVQHSQSHRVRPLWEAKRIRRVAVCLEHPTRQLRYHCLACQQVTCKECMWQQDGHRGHASEDAASAGAQAQIQLAGALKRARKLLNCLLMEYKEKTRQENQRAQTAFDLARDSVPQTYSHQRSRSTLSSHSREARERIHEFSRLRRARYLIDAIFIGEDLLANGSDVEILSLKLIILKRLKFLGVPVDSSCRFNNNGSTAQHSGIYHCCTFCSSGGKKEATCACSGTMPGGYKGCGHGHPGHPGVHHWSCCGSIYRDGICLLPRKCTFKITL